jgi:hypothetical protein
MRNDTILRIQTNKGRLLMALQCPRCKSDNVQKVEMAFKAGTSSLAGNVSGGGVGVGMLGVGVGAGSGKLSGTQQTELAKSLAPPKNQLSTLLALMLVGVPGVTFMMLSLVDTFFLRAGLTWVAVVAISVGIAATVIFLRSDMASKLAAEYRQSMDYWCKTFVCFKCGAQFLPTTQEFATDNPLGPEQR